jgi:hypothetical protein
LRADNIHPDFQNSQFVSTNIGAIRPDYAINNLAQTLRQMMNAERRRRELGGWNKNS